MKHPINTLAKFSNWAWSPLPFSFKSPDSRSGIKFFKSVSQLSGRLLEVCVMINYLTMVVKALKIAEFMREVAPIVLSNTVSIAICALVVLLLARIIAYAMERFAIQKAQA